MSSHDPSPPKGAFNAAQARQLLQSPEGQQLLALLNRDGGAAMRRAANALKSGDESAARQAIAPLLHDPQLAALLEKLTGEKG